MSNNINRYKTPEHLKEKFFFISFLIHLTFIILAEYYSIQFSCGVVWLLGLASLYARSTIEPEKILNRIGVVIFTCCAGLTYIFSDLIYIQSWLTIATLIIIMSFRGLEQFTDLGRKFIKQYSLIVAFFVIILAEFGRYYLDAMSWVYFQFFIL